MTLDNDHMALEDDSHILEPCHTQSTNVFGYLVIKGQNTHITEHLRLQYDYPVTVIM